VRLFFRKQKAAGNDNRIEPATAPAVAADPAHSSVVLAGTNVTGNIDSDGDILIDGSLRGSLRAQRLTVGLDGLIEGDVAADEVTVRGTVKGPIHARHIHLEHGAEVEGDITTTTIAIDTGARLTGAVWQGGQEPQAERDTPVSTASWDSATDTASRSLLSARPRINGSSR
jgi:cytoskeletal protein CcmA (bactofilin family)